MEKNLQIRNNNEANSIAKMGRGNLFNAPKLQFCRNVLLLFLIASFFCCSKKKNPQPNTTTDAVPTIIDFTPKTGEPGTIITITGTDFGKTSELDSIRFGNSSFAEPIHIENTNLTVAVPIDAQTGLIKLVVGKNSVLSKDVFTVISPVPVVTISGFSPVSASVGGIITITGTGFGNDPKAVGIKFGTSGAVKPTSISETNLTVAVPKDATNGFIQLTVTGASSVTSSEKFTIKTTTPPTLTITGFSPVKGSVGDIVTINGTGFGTNANVVAIKFGTSTGVKPKTISVTTMTVAVPTDAKTGKIQVVVSNGTPVSSTLDFTVQPTAPVLKITNFTPTHAKIGATITITGTGFGTDNNAIGVQFGTSKAVKPKTISNTTLTVTVPSEAKTGKIVATLKGGTPVTSSDTFTLDVTPTVTVTGFSPSSARIGDTVTITGTGFGTSINVVNVKFGTSAGVKPKSVATTKIVVVVPADAKNSTIQVTINGGAPVSSSSPFTLLANQPANSISSFTFKTLNPAVAATVNASAHTITFSLRPGTDPTHLQPTITLFDPKGSVTPANGAINDFSKAVPYAVKTADGKTTTNYSAIANRPAASAKDMAATPKALLIYYGYPSAINLNGAGSATRIEDAVTSFAKFDVIVLGGGIEDPKHGDHDKTMQIIDQLHIVKPSIKIFGYIDMGVTHGTNAYKSPVYQPLIIEWRDIHVDGIFADDFGSDYGVDRARRDDFISYVHDVAKIKVFANSFWVGDAMGHSSKLGKGDYYLIEPALVGNGSYYSLPDYKKKADSAYYYMKTTGVGIAAVSTIPASQVSATSNQTDKYSFGYYGASLYNFDAYQFTGYNYSAGSTPDIANIAYFYSPPPAPYVGKPWVEYDWVKSASNNELTRSAGGYTLHIIVDGSGIGKGYITP